MAERKITCSLCGKKYPESNLEYVERDGDKPRPYCSGEGTKNCIDLDDHEGFYDEIATSFVNGNIGWVKKQIDNDLTMFRAVQKVIEECYPASLKSYNRVIGGC